MSLGSIWLHCRLLLQVKMKIVLEIIVAVAFIVAFKWFESSNKRKKIESAFSGREQLTCYLFYNRFFKKENIPFHVVEGVWNILSDHLGTEVLRLIDEDDFSKNLKFFWDFESMADVEIICALERKFGINISDFEAENTHTIRDIVMLVFNKLEACNTITKDQHSQRSL
jgi:acyl carrier protein